jgi:transposase-like protein
VSTQTAKKQRRPARTYTDHFKADAVAMTIELGKPVIEVAKSLDISPSLLYTWVNKSRGGSVSAQPKSDTEIAKLKSELKRLEMENEFLKKAAAFFAKESQ